MLKMRSITASFLVPVKYASKEPFINSIKEGVFINS